MATASAEILKAARIMLGIHQEELARLARISTPTLHKIENGKKGVAIEYVERVQLALEEAGIEFIGEGESSGEGVRWRVKRRHRSEN